ncbi:sacsin N-terminal ATP-binding-like domain-containing protein [Flavobacterium sp. XS2P39]|uniref:sacsin N-terminal ATP-binding-like domain-containing protein n=1 Tax=Flavobacterium sp. XS2P39 TaxID=3401725 RepID=UPI003AB0E2D4
MEKSLQINRDIILKNAELESELSDLKQHADKMIRGFENFNNFSSNRAIWEMVQNACDLTNDCEVVIDYSKENFSFSHNGKPFTTKALISLIKQVSGKYGEESDLREVGKYGTGFLTTHTFGRKFLINSILGADSAFFEIKDFSVDRSPKEWKGLSANIKLQKDNVYKLIKEGTIISSPVNKTTFTYLPETEQEINYITESSTDLEDYVPIVLTINNRLKKVTIKDKNGIETIFVRTKKGSIPNSKNINLFKTEISRNGDNKILYSIIDEDSQIEVILPINAELELIQFSDRMARLFLYYPLVGSENFGLNFIINCNEFLPTEPRDGIHLKSNKDQVKNQEEANRRIIKKASELIFSFLKSNVLLVSNPLLYAKINFKRTSENSFLNEYFEELQELWTEELKQLPIVRTLEGFKTVDEAYFFNQELLASPEVFEEIYEIASLFYQNIPVKNDIILWSKFVNEWTNDDVKFIGHQDLVSFISNENLSKFDESILKNYYNNLIANDKVYLFSEHTLLPNLDGEFCLLSALLSPENLTSTLIDFGKILIPHFIGRLVHQDFIFEFHFEKFNRKDFSNRVKTRLDEMQALDLFCMPEKLKKGHFHEIDFDEIKTLEYVFFTTLLNYCKLNNNLKSQSKPSQLTKIISKYYSLEDDLIYLPRLELQEENLDIRSARKILVKVFFNLLQLHDDEWVKDNILLLLEIANCYEDSLKEVYLVSKIYPNQVNKLKSINDLKKDLNVSEEIKDLFNKVTKDDIRSSLIYKQFNDFVTEDRFVTNKYLTTEIENIFFNTDINDINEHPFKEDILNIISKLRDKQYSDLFPRLDDKKANLMLAIVTNENTKDDIFSIVMLKEEQLKKLGKLIQNENFEAILNKAAVVLQQEAEKKTDFRHKYEIGRNIERLIREKLSAELLDRITFVNHEKLEASDIQGGQDIVVLLDSNPIYFIEVKSRWNSVNSVSMSKLQLQRAVEENDRYALCSVDISRYVGKGDRYNLSIEEILPLTKFVKEIGNDIRPLIEENLNAEKNQEESIHLIDYRGIIPQDIIQIGDDFSDFIESLQLEISKFSSKPHAELN